MVGGSVNGRPFREDPSSYSRTGIPCGNPRRYNSRGVVRMAPNPRAPFEDQRLDIPPMEHAETEGERQFKRLLDKQLNKEMTIDQLLQEKRVFTTPSTYQPLTEEISGKLLLSDFQAVEREKERKMQLQQCGLTAEEITLKEKCERKAEISGYGVEPKVLTEKLLAIKDKIASKQKELETPANSRDVHYMGRHEMEIERSLKSNSDQAQLFQTLVSTERPPCEHTHPDDPINHLSGMEREMFGHLQRKKKKRKKEDADDDETELESLNSYVGGKHHDDVLVTTATSIDPKAKAAKRNAKYFRPRPLVFHDAESIKSNKITVDEICQLPKFENYNCGSPSKTLFVKNLTKSVCLDDLNSVFGACCESGDASPSIRLMTGKMRGQAFVEFENVSMASKALALINGFKLHEKPIVLQYGKNGT